MGIRDKMKKEVGVKVDDFLVVEGCESDDKIVLGGKDAFYPTSAPISPLTFATRTSRRQPNRLITSLTTVIGLTTA